MAYFAIALLGFAIAFGVTLLWRVGVIAHHPAPTTVVQTESAAALPSPEVSVAPVAPPSFEPPPFSTNDALTASQTPAVAPSASTAAPAVAVRPVAKIKATTKKDKAEGHRAIAKPMRIHRS